MKQFLSNLFGYLLAGIPEGVQRSTRILVYGLMSTIGTSSIDYLSHYKITNEYGTLGFIVITYAINILLGFLNKWVFTTQKKAQELEVPAQTLTVGAPVIDV